jgi:hypothetical protein
LPLASGSTPIASIDAERLQLAVAVGTEVYEIRRVGECCLESFAIEAVTAPAHVAGVNVDHPLQVIRG